MITQEPLVSVIIPTHNREGYLREAVQSVLDQTYRNWELIVVDDGSTDGTASFLCGLGDSRVVVIEHEHCRNPSLLRNLAISKASGEYIAFLDSDDLWMREKLAVQVQTLRADRARKWSYTDFVRIDSSGLAIEHVPRKPWIPYSGFILEKLLTLDAIVISSAVLVEKQLLDAVHGFDEDQLFCEDYDLWFRLAATGGVLAIPRALSKVRNHSAHYSADRLGVHRGWVRAYETVWAANSDDTIGRLCHQECARHSVKAAAIYLARRKVGHAAKSLFGAFRYDIWSVRWWGVLAKPLARMVIPQVLWQKSGKAS